MGEQGCIDVELISQEAEDYLDTSRSLPTPGQDE